MQVETLFQREEVISHQMLGAILELVDPIEIAAVFVSSWPFHPQVSEAVSE